MPTLFKTGAARVVMYVGDHPPPHVHVILSDGRDCTVNLSNQRIVGTIAAGEIRAPLSWINANLRQLLANWERLNP